MKKDSLEKKRFFLHFFKNSFSKKTIIILLFVFSSTFFLFPKENKAIFENFPRIQKLDSRNVVFAQYQEEVLEANMEMVAGKNPLLNFYSYLTGPDDTLFTLAARCSIPIETLASANGICDVSGLKTGEELFLPTVSGIFIPEKSETTLEILLSQEFAPLLSGSISESKRIEIVLKGKKYTFLPGQRFSSSTRTFFLDSSFKLPLEKSTLTSDYGMRESPISGKWKFHEGIDMAASEGSPVFSCKGGFVEKTVNNDNIYGNFIVIKHDEGISSLYAHLKEIYVKKGDKVLSGEKIGSVGNTGMSTGPHLHFEIMKGKNKVDPKNFIKKQ